MTIDASVENLLRDLVIANRALAAENVIDDFGHISARHPTNCDHFFLSRSRSPELVSADDLMEFSLDGAPVAHNGERMYLERYIHAAIYRERSDVNCVVHHHARSVLPFATTPMRLRPMFHMAAVIGPDVPTWDSQEEFGDTNMLIDSMPMALSLARALSDGSCVLLRGHGAVCVSSNIAGACFVSVYLKENAELLLKTLPLSVEPTYLTPGEVEKTRAILMSEVPLARAWQYWKSRAGYVGI